MSTRVRPVDDAASLTARAGAADASWLHSAGPTIPAAVPAAASDRKRRRLRGARAGVGSAVTDWAITSGLLVSFGVTATSVPDIFGGDEGERDELGRVPGGAGEALGGLRRPGRHGEQLGCGIDPGRLRRVGHERDVGAMGEGAGEPPAHEGGGR